MEQNLVTRFVEKCLYVTSSRVSRKKIVMLEMWGACCEPDLLGFLCESISKKAEKYINETDVVGIAENCGQVLGSMLVSSLQKPMILLTEKEKPGFRPKKFDFGSKGRSRILIVDAMIQSGLHLDNIIKRIGKKGGAAVAIVVVVDNDLARKERKLDLSEKIPIEALFRTSEIKSVIEAIHGAI